VHYLDFLARLHRVLDPPRYFEIGVRNGQSLALARASAVGVDPAYRLKVPLRDDVRLFRETSDEYFYREEPLKPFGGGRIAMSFIDGMHLSEFVVRDFANVEAFSAWTTVVVLDDILPRTVTEAARDRRTRAWTGDVYKVLEVLRRYRPDLVCLSVDTQPTGLGLILDLDPESTVLKDRYDEIVADVVSRDPQEVPAAVLERAHALAPEAVLDSSLWRRLDAMRRSGVPRRRGVRQLHRVLDRELGVTGRSLVAPA
jgi:hypothetical protein